MSSQEEDTLYEVHTEVTKSGLWDEFNAQLKKMRDQDKHKWKNICERWEYALSKIKKDNGGDNRKN